MWNLSPWLGLFSFFWFFGSEDYDIALLEVLGLLVDSPLSSRNGFGILNQLRMTWPKFLYGLNYQNFLFVDGPLMQFKSLF